MCSDLKLSVEVGAGLPKLIARSRTGSTAFEVALTSSEQIGQIMRLLATARDYLPKQVTGPESRGLMERIAGELRKINLQEEEE